MKSQKGASAVEFAIVLPVLVTLLFGIIEFSIIFYDQAVITNASREGARAGIVYWCPDAEDLEDLEEEEIKARRKEHAETEAKIAAHEYCGNATASPLITFGSAAVPTVNATLEGDGDPGDNLTVTVGYHYDYLVIPNFISSLDKGGKDLEARTVMRLE
jgi:Flp pilus assembly protein TadG